ncbi:MAG: histidine phosphatase family protein, partial [Thermomicrobiales bacterium]
MRFLLVRHGESTYNAEGRIQRQQDAPLSERGRRQVERIGERLRSYSFDACYASDLSRAADTARAIMQHHPDVPFEFTTLLREIKFGIFEGRIMP